VANQIRNEMEKIEIPEELQERTIIGVSQAKREMSNSPRKKYKSTIVAAAAAVIILSGSLLALGGTSNLVEAGQTLISQIFGSEENVKRVDPVAAAVDLQGFEKHLALAEQVLTEDEFSNYRNLLQELGQLVTKMNVMENGVKTQNINLLTKEEQNRLQQIQTEMEPYEKTFSKETNFSFEEAKAFANYPIQYPAYVPEGYKLAHTAAITEEGNPNENPVVHMEYKSGEFGFRIFILSNQTEDEITRRSFKKLDPYSFKGYTIEYAHSDDTNVSGMRLLIPATGQQAAYKLVIIADILTKDEMEKIILSTLEN
jgi:hypothetical protein